MAPNTTTPPAPQAQTTPANKDISTKSTTAARVTVTNGPAAAAVELRKSRRKRPGKSNLTADKQPLKTLTGHSLPHETTSDTQPPISTHLNQEEHGTVPNDPAANLATDTTNGSMSNAQDQRIALQPISMPSFFEESLDILPASPSPNSSVNRSQVDLLVALQNEALTSTPCVENQSQPNAAMEANQATPMQAPSLRERLLEAEERRSSLGNFRPNARNALDKYTMPDSDTGMPTIHYAHPTTTLDNLDLDLVGDWESLPKGKLLAQPFGPEVRNIENHPQLKALLFAAIVEITNSRDVSVCAPKPKNNSRQSPISFLVYNVTEQQAQILLERCVWSSIALTFSVSAFYPNCPEYLLSIKNLTIQDEKEVRRTVYETWHDEASFTFLQTIYQHFPENVKEQASHALQAFTNSLKVSRLDTKLPGNTLAPVFNVYADGPLIGNDNTWSQIRAFLASREYTPQTQDPGTTIIAPYRCSICHAADHPRGLCPFPIIPGWNGPKRREPITTPGGPGGGPGTGPNGLRKPTQK